MTKTSLAYAKINMSLDIVSKMADGYHNMKMVMQSVGLSDEITIETEQGEGIIVDAGLPFLPGDERNIAAKAARTFYDYTGITGHRTSIRIVKNIPVCAGLGGGSADGACVLRMLNDMFSAGLGRGTLEKLGAGVGSDIPFCIAGGTSLVEGRGDMLTDLTPIPQSYIVICKPPFSCSTPELFAKVRCGKIRARPDTEGMIAELGKGDLNGVARRMYNVFEDIMPRGASDIAEIKYALLDKGALGAVMTGSGPAVFGLFSDEALAEKAHDGLKSNYKECYLTKTVERLDLKC